METLEIESQTDQTPLASSSLYTTQRELAEAQHILDDPDHRFNGAFACRVDRFAYSRLELVCHFHPGVRILRRRIGQWCETLVPTAMMGIATRGDVGLDAASRTCSQRCGAKIPSIQCCRLWCADGWRNGLERGLGFLAIIGVIGEGTSHDEQTRLIHGNLRVVLLLKASIGRIFHDTRLGVGEIILVAITRPWRGRRRRTATRATPRRALPLCTLGHLGIILRLFSCRTLGGTGLEHHFGFCQPRQTVL